MGRILKRVPLDFNWPINKPWEGYAPSIETLKMLFGKELPWILECKKGIDICAGKCPGKEYGGCWRPEDAPYCVWYNPQNRQRWYHEVPEGPGYQAWQNTGDPSPISPVFVTLEELCAWCAENNTVFADKKATAEGWKAILTGEGYAGVNSRSGMRIIAV